MVAIQCEQCGESHMMRTSSQPNRFCSDACRQEHHSQQRYRGWQGPLQPTCCAACNQTFMPSAPRVLYCSASCRKRVGWGKRNALKHSAPSETVDPIVVLTRGGWMCAICAVETPRELRGSFRPNAPEVDHIVPLSKGGAHTYANTQCLCRNCNQAKSNKLAA
jgi:hypothetical protein